MLTEQEYKENIGKIGRKFLNPNINWNQWHNQYCYYEKMWDEYFEKIFRARLGDKNDKCVQIVCWESCPGGMPFPHQNYVFDANRFNNTIDGSFDSYLKLVCKHFNIAWKSPNGKNKKIKDIITEISINKILIVDLYPTHGISLDSSNRKNLFKNLFSLYSMQKLKQIVNNIGNNCICKEILVTSELKNAGINKDMDGDLLLDLRKVLNLNENPIFQTI